MIGSSANPLLPLTSERGGGEMAHGRLVLSRRARRDVWEEMKVFTLRREQTLPGSPEEVFPFFADARNLEAITPPLLKFEVVTPGEIPMRVGTLIQYRLRVHGVGVDWLTSIQEWDPPQRFVDVQVRGPYALWHHTHEFSPGAEPDTTVMRDTVRYAIGFGPFGQLAARAFVHRDVRAIFDHRAQAVPALLLGRGDGLPPGKGGPVWRRHTSVNGPTAP